jgi:alkaline phosphatase
MAEEMFDFATPVGKVLEWAEKDGHTLVIVTADHGTGGVTLVGGSLEDCSVKVHYSTKGHHGIVVPVFAYGPHAEDFIGVYENSDLSNRIRKLMK